MHNKEAFYSSVSTEDITDVDYQHGKRVFQNVNNKHLGDTMICVFKVITYCLQIYLRILEINLLKYMSFILLILYLHLD